MSDLIVTQGMLDKAKAQGCLGWCYLHPKQFLDLSVPGDVDKWIKEESDPEYTKTVDEYNQYVRMGSSQQLPWLDVEFKTGKVIGHDGRHRAISALNCGSIKFPVALHYVQDGNTVKFTAGDLLPATLLPQFNAEPVVKLPAFNENFSEKVVVKSSTENTKLDTVTLDVPLFIRLLELAREDLKTDIQLHDVVESVLHLTTQKSTLTMKDYGSIMKTSVSADFNKRLKKLKEERKDLNKDLKNGDDTDDEKRDIHKDLTRVREQIHPLEHPKTEVVKPVQEVKLVKKVPLVKPVHMLKT